jgi:hypothetical protein
VNNIKDIYASGKMSLDSIVLEKLAIYLSEEKILFASG